MLETLEPLPPDPILGLIGAFQRDPNPHKVDLGAGVYRDAEGRTPIFGAVRKAQERILATQETKSYVAPPGDRAFIDAVTRELLGPAHAALADGRVAAVQTPGGCGALRLGAELVDRVRPGADVWVSTPTWANHAPLLGDAGLRLRSYPYYDRAARRIDVDGMLEALGAAGPGDLVVLHGCCHNPTGADLSPDQWDAVCDLVTRRGATPFVDLAYHGLGDGLEADAYGARVLAERAPELLVAYSCSKNFGLYRERAGLLVAVAPNPAAATAAGSQLNAIARGIYSMPPAHGAAIVGTILGDDDLAADWRAELTHMRERLGRLRGLLAERMAARGVDHGFVADQRGLFSLLDVSVEQIERLRAEHGVYLVGNGRINVAGISDGNVDHLADALVAVGRDRAGR